MGISDRTRKLLWGLSGNQCAICQEPLIAEATQADRESVVGDECHIVSGKPDGPRYNQAFPQDEVDEYPNLLLLCKIHHKMVDDQTKTYTADRLRQIKAEHEKRIALSLQESPQIAGLPTIPPPTRDFTGRTNELEELRRMVDEHGGAMIYGVRGLGGIGKTELGLKLVETVGDDYPDGHILVELGGASDHPLSSADAMASVIRAYEPQAQLPEAEADLRRIYHQVLNDRRAIVLLDNAASAEQVKPLLPHTGCLTLVTSRQRFALPKLHRLDLDALTPEAAQELLLSLAPRLGKDAARIAELLGRLPLALRLAGSAFAERPDLEPGEYVRRLEHRSDRVGLVEGAISFNYEALDQELQQYWRALAVFPGDFDVAGAAAVWATTKEAAKEVLGGALYLGSLVDWRGGRFRLHDLARDFATHQLESEEESLAAKRHARYYFEVLKVADHRFVDGGLGILEGLALLDREWSNIKAAQEWPAGHVDGAQETGSVSVGLRHAPLRNAVKAIGLFRQALDSAREKGDRRGEGTALKNLGFAYYQVGKGAKAISYFEKFLAIAREIGDRHGECSAMEGLGISYVALGKQTQAIGYHERFLTIAREIGNRRGEGYALRNLGSAYRHIKKLGMAIGYFEEFLVIARETGDRRDEAEALKNLGLVYADVLEVEKAVRLLEAALEIGQLIKDPRIVDPVTERLEELRGLLKRLKKLRDRRFA